MRPFRLLTFVLLVAAAVAQQPALSLPRAFGGWVLNGAATQAQMSPAQRSLFEEFHLAASATGQYGQNGRKLVLTLYSFPDVTDAYGAFTFAHPANVVPEKIGEGAVSTDDEVVFFHGNLLADVKLDRMNAMTLAQMRDLNAALPIARNAGNMPSVQKYLPVQGYVEGSLRYVIGPVGLAQSGAPLNASQVDFDVSPEIVVAHYSTATPPATLTLVSYPTPQIAAARMRGLVVPDALIKRTHSILAVASGTLTADDAKALLGSISYDAEVTWNEPTKTTPRDDLFGLLWNITLLSAVLIGFMLLIGFFFGGFRLLYFRLYPAKAEQYEEQRQLIRLNLR